MRRFRFQGLPACFIGSDTSCATLRLQCSFAVAALLLVVAWVPATAGHLDPVFDCTLAQRPPQLVGGVIAVVGESGSPVIRPFGVADKVSASPMTAEALFPLASITKTVTALLAVRMAARGQIDLDAPIDADLPPLHKTASGAGITPRHLLAHRAGYPQDQILRRNLSLAEELGFDPTIRSAENQTRVAATAGFAATPLMFVPGERRHYSNIGYEMAGRALENVAGRSMADLIDAELRQPLKLASFTTRPTTEQFKRVPTAYMTHPRSGATVDVPAWQPGETVGAIGLYATAGDLARYLQLMMQAASDEDAVKKQLLQPGALFDHQSGALYRQALGWWVDDLGVGGPLYRHNGDADGHSAFTAWSPERGFGVAILTSGSYDHMTKFGNRLLIALMQPESCLIKRDVPDADD